MKIALLAPAACHQGNPCTLEALNAFCEACPAACSAQPQCLDGEWVGSCPAQLDLSMHNVEPASSCPCVFPQIGTPWDGPATCDYEFPPSTFPASCLIECAVADGGALVWGAPSCQ
jgi:hypothetical protein